MTKLPFRPRCSRNVVYSPRNDLLLRTALALQHWSNNHDRPQLPATTIHLHSPTPPTSATRNDRPATFNDSTYISFPQRLYSCIQRFDRPQLPATTVQLHSTTRPTSASRNHRPAAFNDSTDLSFPQRPSSCIQRLDRPQLPATTVQLHSTTQLTSAARNDHPAASYDSTDNNPTRNQQFNDKPPPSLQITKKKLLSPIMVTLNVKRTTSASYNRSLSWNERLPRDTNVPT